VVDPFFLLLSAVFYRVLSEPVVAVSVASALSMLGPTNNRSVIYGILLLAAVLGFAWLFSASLMLAAPRRR
jgi:hypothetical protein